MRADVGPVKNPNYIGYTYRNNLTVVFGVARAFLSGPVHSRLNVAACRRRITSYCFNHTGEASGGARSKGPAAGPRKARVRVRVKRTVTHRRLGSCGWGLASQDRVLKNSTAVRPRRKVPQLARIVSVCVQQVGVQAPGLPLIRAIDISRAG